ncbi:hypothetical protein SDC9_154665 [bioreactor metagenome]|uniref:Uncharacterized protein n=1 Tax=bioreactor metagenome TaxID=1076179 RepID=A0A645EZB2_9ZZZZ
MLLQLLLPAVIHLNQPPFTVFSIFQPLELRKAFWRVLAESTLVSYPLLPISGRMLHHFLRQLRFRPALHIFSVPLPISHACRYTHNLPGRRVLSGAREPLERVRPEYRSLGGAAQRMQWREVFSHLLALVSIRPAGIRVSKAIVQAADFRRF